MGRSPVELRIKVAVMAGVAVAIAGCQYRPGAPLVLHGNGGVGGAVIDAGATGQAGAGGSGGSRPVIPTIDAAPRADASSMSNLDSNCAAVNQGAAPLPPDILIVQDRSGSMDWNADATCMRNCGADSRWNQVTAALTQVVARRIRWSTGA